MQYEEPGNETVYSDDPYAPAPRPGPNVIGIVGLVLAFCLPPIGLLLSLIGLTRAPRLIPVIGVVIGGIGTGLIVMAVAFVWPFVVWSGDFARDYEEIGRALENAKTSSPDGVYPDSLAGLGLSPGAMEDGNGLAYRYEVSEDGSSWSLTIAGLDGAFDTPDDATFTSDMTEDEIATEIGESIQRSMGSR